MDMRLGDANQASQSSFGELAAVNTIPDEVQQLELSILEGQWGRLSAFQFEIGSSKSKKSGRIGSHTL
jgi:hypothetical protein